MPKVEYERTNMKPATLQMIDTVNSILDEYEAQGYDLTLRQVYYQLVSRGLIANKQSEYKKLGDIVSKGRRAGLIDWGMIVDRTREIIYPSSWESPSTLIEICAETFRYDLWKDQSNYIVVLFEKDALMGVFERAVEEWRLPFLSCRGYPSDSTIWQLARSLRRVITDAGHIVRRDAMRKIHILHFGDHDPSGIDMTRDIEDRLRLFGADAGLPSRLKVERLALTMQQIRLYDPPPNPAKETDTRFADYKDKYGDESWELDALEPQVITDLIRLRVSELLDLARWKESLKRELKSREELQLLSHGYTNAIQFLEDRNSED